MPFSIPSLNYRAVRVGRVNRKQGVAFATMNKETLGVRVTEGEGSLPKVVLTSAGGSEAELYLFGGCVTSWKASNDKDLLFVRPDAVFNWKKPIRYCYLSFVRCSSIMSFLAVILIKQHGFARNMDWSILDSENVEGNPVITLELKDGPYSRAMWDFSFQALFKASVTGASVKGLKGCKTLNKDPDPKNPVEGKEERWDRVTFPGFVDCIYLDAPSVVHLDNGLGDTITIRNTNWSDAVLWNPHMQMEACYKDFVCVENAKIGKVQLEPEQSWTAKQHLSIN
ncbi:glucose-6-phosphate 1-epimerase [Citrus sinensis]|uniref:Glucose-6-phosphate 1-epimerase n=2 Tax=Citrus sinensis TaxID=2711 RepID=A0ACB8J1A6_CITSI|nr:glucose-6-phosphate 1-epimerase [Citrus sinensis]